MGCIQDLAHSLKIVAASGLVALTLTANTVAKDVAQDKPLTHKELSNVFDIFVREQNVELGFGISFFEVLGRKVLYQRVDIGGNGVYDITVFYDIDAIAGDHPIGVIFDNGDGQWDTTSGDLYYFKGKDGLYHRGNWNEHIKNT